jgi:hypothetical protein
VLWSFANLEFPNLSNVDFLIRVWASFNNEVTAPGTGSAFTGGIFRPADTTIEAISIVVINPVTKIRKFDKPVMELPV